MKFTFGVFCYNHEKYIIELLESIKYQAINYGDGIACSIVVSDDASKDATVYLVKKWLDVNGSLFTKTMVLEAEQNQGTVENYKKIMKYIEDDNFKVIAGDDVFANSNIFSCLKEADEHCIVTYMPTILMSGNVFLRQDWYVKHRAYMKKKRSHRYDVKKQEQGSYFHTPCTFFHKTMYEKYYEGKETEFRLFEDDPLWHTLLTSDSEARVIFREDTLVLYRMHENQICGSAQSPYALEFAKELKKYKSKIMKEEVNLFVKLNLLMQIHRPTNKFLDLISYKEKVFTWVREKRCSYDERCRQSYQNINSNLEKTQEYYSGIYKTAKSLKELWIQESGGNV